MRDNMHGKLPPEFQGIAELAEQQRPEVQEVFRFILAVAMEESSEANLTGRTQVEGRTHYSYRTAAGDVLALLRPAIHGETEVTLREKLETQAERR